MEYLTEQLKNLLKIHSPSGFTKEVAGYVFDRFKELGYAPELTRKGGVIVEIGGSGNPLVFASHADTLGGMVAKIKENGRLELTNIGGLKPNNIETENCYVHTRSGKIVEGTMQLNNASLHVNDDYSTAKREFSTMEVVLDEVVASADETKKLGIQTGDYVCFDPRTRITEKGFIKSRFLDDKLSVAILLQYAKDIKENNLRLNRKIYLYITVYEEVGHGASDSIPPDALEVISVDMGCIGEGLSCNEHMVSICVKDSYGPYDYEVTSKLIELAEKNGLNYAADVYPHYSSDVDMSLSAGYPIKHGLIGPGVYASHGYERSHLDGAENTLKLIKAYTAEI